MLRSICCSEYASNRLGQANNRYMGEDYDSSKPSKYIIYLDANNLYGWAMSKLLPTHWMNEEELQDWRSFSCILVVDLSSRGGECTSLLGPGEPYTPNSEKDTSCLGPAEPYAPSTHISELIVLAHIGKKLRARRALYAQLRRRHQLLRPCRTLCPSHEQMCSHKQKKRAQGTANHPRRPGLSFRYACGYGYVYHA